MDNKIKLLRVEANSGAVICFGIASLTIATMFGISKVENTKKEIAVRELEERIRKRNVDAQARRYESEAEY